MGIENIKRWQWCLIAIGVGVVLAFVFSLQEPGSGLLGDYGEISSVEFESELVKHDFGGKPNITDVVVHVPTQGVYGKPVHVVTMLRAVHDGTSNTWKYKPTRLIAEVPYLSYARARRGTGHAIASSSGRTVLDALHDLSEANPGVVHYRYAWWELAPWRYTLWIAGMLIVVGGIWPSLVSLCIRAGLLPQPVEREKTISLFAPKLPKSSSPVLAGAAPSGFSAADQDKFEAQLDRLEQSLSPGMQSLTDVPAANAPNGAPAAIVPLNGGPVEAAPVQADSEEDKDYKGEYYPVARVSK